MNICRISVILCFTIVLASCGESPESILGESVFDDPGITAIYDAANIGNTVALAAYANSHKPAYRATYAKLMGSVQPIVAPKELEDLLTDPIPYVRLYAAFAVGQIGNEKSLTALDKAFKKATIPEIKAEFLEAIGKCADENAMGFLVSHNPNTAVEEAGKVWGIYRGMLKGRLKEEHLDIVTAHLASSEDETRLAAANILARQRDFDLGPYEDEIFRQAVEETSKEVKATLGHCLSRTDQAKAFAVQTLRTEDNTLLRTVALSIIPQPQEHLEILENGLISDSPWVAMTAAKRLKDVDDFVPSASTVASARTTRIPEVSALVAASLLQADPSLGREFYEQAWTSLRNPVKRSVLLGIWADFPEGIDTLHKYILIDGPLGTAATMTYLRGMEGHAGWKDRFVPYAEKAFDQGLFAQTTLFAEALRAPENKDLIGKDRLLTALDKFSKPELVEGHQTIAKTLLDNYGVETPPLVIDHPAIDWEMVRSLGQTPKLVIFVNGEGHSITLVPEDAPASCAHIAKLSEQGFYDGTHFHRIVPAFVTQGGGPRGDGFGSDDHILRSEFSPLKYGTGVVGLASAGKDTESCQFFFTHMPTPHLDGRYTIIGASLDDVFGIETGAGIDSVRVRRDMGPM